MPIKPAQMIPIRKSHIILDRQKHAKISCTIVVASVVSHNKKASHTKNMMT